MNDATMTEAPPALPPETGNAAVDSRARHDHFAALTAFYEKRGASAPAAATPAAPTTSGGTLAEQPSEAHELAKLLAAQRDADGRRLADDDGDYRLRVDEAFRAAAEGRTLDAESRKLLEELREEAALDAELDAIGPDEFKVDAIRVGEEIIEVDRRSPIYRAAAAQAYELGLDRRQFEGMMRVAVAWEQALHGGNQ